MLGGGGQTYFGIITQIPLLIDFDIRNIVSSNSTAVVYYNSIQLVLLIGARKS